jgi:hypothetical protein
VTCLKRIARPQADARLDLTTGERTQGPIFLTADGRRLDRHGAGRIVRRIARRAAITKPVGPHTLRQAFFTADHPPGNTERHVRSCARTAVRCGFIGFVASLFVPRRPNGLRGQGGAGTADHASFFAAAGARPCAGPAHLNGSIPRVNEQLNPG